MSLRQFTNSIQSILTHPGINRWSGVARHLGWQARKALNRFPVELRLSRSRLVATHGRCGVSALVNSQGLYDYHNMNLLLEVMRPGRLMFDVGANIGAYALLASEPPAARVFAFEPHPATFGLLRRNLDLNQRANVTPFNLALGAHDGGVTFSDAPGSALNCIVADAASGAIRVACARAETVCRRHGFVPDVVKIDVEGFEYDVLKGFGGLLGRVELVLVELNGLSDARARGAAEIHRLLAAHGFSGPFACDFARRRFVPHGRMRRREDAIYLGRNRPIAWPIEAAS